MSESEIAIGLRLARDGKEMESASLQILCVGRARLGVVLPVCMPRGFWDILVVIPETERRRRVRVEVKGVLSSDYLLGSGVIQWRHR